IPNKDLILRYRVAGETTRSTVLTQADKRGGHFAVYLIPALNYPPDRIVPKDVVFLMDTSGSQRGEPLAKSKELMRHFIQGLNPRDTFTIIDFANTAKVLSATPLANTAQNKQSAMTYIANLEANGGTELLNGLKTVMNFPAPETGRLRSIVLITDGYIGAEKEVLAFVQSNLKPGNRLYSFGVGGSVNRFLLNRLAEVGRGTSQVIRQDEPTAAAEKFIRQINNPVLTDLQVSWEGGSEKPEIYPIALPDLFASQPLVLFGRKGDRVSGKLRIRGTLAGGQVYEQILPVNFSQSVSLRQRESNPPTNGTDFGNPAIAQLWGRSRIKDLMNQMFGGQSQSLVESVTNTALTYRLLSEYTAFVAVSEEVRVEPDGTRRRVQVPVELPQGVSYEGVFDRQEAAEQTRGGSRNYAPTRGGYAPPPPGPRRQAVYEPPPRQQLTASQLQVVTAEGLDARSIALLTQHLQSIILPPSLSGEMVWVLSVDNGRVTQVAIDPQASTLPADVVENLKQALTSWRPPAGLKGAIRVKLQVRAER
ncbi:MAG: after-VIT domain-containing protein, partial [Microcoleus sp.]